MKNFALLVIVLFTSCEHYLNEVPDRSLSTIDDIQAYQQLMSYPSIYVSPALADLGADDLSLSGSAWQAADIRTRVAYAWLMADPSLVHDMGTTQDWSYPYNSIYYCNVVLEGLDRLDLSPNNPAASELKGQALFLRAFQHFSLCELYGQPYNPATASTVLGVPIKLTSLPEEKVARATVGENFRQIIRDLEQALKLTSASYQPVNVYKTSKAAIHALLSRVYLVMQDYAHAYEHAKASLSHYDVLLDFNGLPPGYQFVQFEHPEVLFFAIQTGASALYRSATTNIAPELYQLYDDADLRKGIFFQIHEQIGLPIVRSMYSGLFDPFSGLATDEVYLNLAESAARLGYMKEAAQSLNSLLSNRFEEETFKPVKETGQEKLLATILQERRKELVIRGVRWSDLRRLNQDERFAKTLVRTLNDQTYRLEPNDKRYAYPIPPKEVDMSGLIQNAY